MNLNSCKRIGEKSRIPVPIFYNKAFSLCNTEKTLPDKKPTSKSPSNNCKSANPYHLQKTTVKKYGSQTTKLKNCPLQKVTVKNFSSQATKLKKCPLQKVTPKKYTYQRTKLEKLKVKRSECKTNVPSSSNSNKENKTEKSVLKHNPIKKGLLTTNTVKSNLYKRKEQKNVATTKSMPILRVDLTDNNHQEKLCTPGFSCSNRNESSVPYRFEDFSAQKGIKFEANEYFRNMILSNRELSPSMCKQMPSLRWSSLQAERPSAYQKFEIPDDPLKEVLERLKTVKRHKKVPGKENKAHLSPYKERGSFYTPCANPKEELMKHLKEFHLKRLQKTVSKSTKKVTFNLDDIKEYSNIFNAETQSVRSKEVMLSQINERSKENTPNSPQTAKNEEVNSTQHQIDVCAPNFDLKDVEHQNTKAVSQSREITPQFESLSIKTPATKSPLILSTQHVFPKCLFVQNKETVQSTKHVFPKCLFVQNKETLQNVEETTQNIKKTDCLTLSSNVCDNKKIKHGIYTYLQNTMQLPEQSIVNAKTAKIYTPRPISFSSKSILNESYSPEYLVGGKATLMTQFPICTPLVLRNIAKKNMFSPEEDLSPVRIKLDFTGAEKDSPKREAPRTQPLSSLENITTTQKLLDDLADQECCLLLLSESTTVICGRYLINPVALTLDEGDDMHFIPIQF